MVDQRIISLYMYIVPTYRGVYAPFERESVYEFRSEGSEYTQQENAEHCGMKG